MITPPLLTGLGDVNAWVGLKPTLTNVDDQGTLFDVKAELLKNGNLVASGLTRCVTNVTRNPALARDAIESFGAFAPVTLDSGDILSLRLSTRIGTTPSDAQCGGHSSAAGLRLYYDASLQKSYLGTTIGAASSNLYLHSDGNACTNTAESSGVTTRFLSLDRLERGRSEVQGLGRP